MWTLGQRVIDISGKLPALLSHHPTKFGGHKSCASKDILFLVCHVTSRDYLVREVHGMISLVISDFSAKFGDHRLFGRGDI